MRDFHLRTGYTGDRIAKELEGTVRTLRSCVHPKSQRAQEEGGGTKGQKPGSSVGAGTRCSHGGHSYLVGATITK